MAALLEVMSRERARMSGHTIEGLSVAEKASAKIIPFPRVAPDRLTRALATLDAALAQQRSATAAWRETVAELQGAMHGLRASLRDYDTALSTLSHKVGALNAESRRLEAWADEVIDRAAR